MVKKGLNNLPVECSVYCNSSNPQQVHCFKSTIIRWAYCIVTFKDFTDPPTVKILNHFLQHDSKQCHSEVLLSNFHIHRQSNV